MNALPQYHEAVVGFRAWRPRPDGVLTPWTMTGAAWRQGANEGRCLILGGGARGRRHAVPGRECTCGLYALMRPDDPRLDPLGAVVGSIAAWGEIEVHATGFRARYAAITGLAVDARASAAHRALLAAAARHYDVALVAADDLDRHARDFGRTVEFDAIPPTPSWTAPPRGPGLHEHGLRGIAVDDHVWVEIAPGDTLTLGVTAAFAGEIAIGSPIRAAADRGRRRRSGETLLVIGDGPDALLVRAPVDLEGTDVNPCLAADPDLVRTDPERRGWLLHAAPASWEEQAGDVLWGRRGETIYRASVAHAARHEDPFGWCKPSFIERQPPARSAADALAILRAERSPPRFADGREAEERIGGRLAAALADADIRRRARRAGVRLALRLHGPEADLEIDLAGDERRPAPTITLYAAAETADDFLAGRLDIASALRSRRIQTDAPHTRVLVIASLIKELQRAYRAAG